MSRPPNSTTYRQSRRFSTCRFLGDVDRDGADEILAVAAAEFAQCGGQCSLVDIGQHHAGAFLQQAVPVALPMPPAPPVTSAILPASIFGFGMRCSLASSSSQYSMSKASCSGRPT
jgi:hypothetical protein